MPSPSVTRPRIAVEPRSGRHESLLDAVVRGGAQVSDVESADALVWADAARPDLLPAVLAAGSRLSWVQLPFAGIEPYLALLDPGITWTCGKGVYARPVAEHALAMALAGMRHLVGYARADRWSGPVGRNLLDARVTIVGGGEITRELIDLLEPFRAEVTVVRRQATAVRGAARTTTTEQLDDALEGADLVVLTLALTPETEGVVGARQLRRMEDHAWLVNVARGRHVVTEDLVAALVSGEIGGAALDVTDPEPLPHDHPLWTLDNCLITPHVGNTPSMGVPLLAGRVEENVRRFAAGEPLLGLVDVSRGY